MTEPTQPTGETPAAPTQAAGTSVTPPLTDKQPAAEPPVEEWDKERAAATIKAQREQEKVYKAQLKELEALKAEKQKQAEAQMTEAERAKKQADELALENAKLKADLLRREVVAETGIPSILADRLHGTTKEELLADAQKLLELLPKPKTATPTIGATNPSNGQQVRSLDVIRKERDSRQVNPFEVNVARSLGGGGIVPEE